jgi:hypothetical protein
MNMASCAWCEQEMKDKVSCAEAPVEFPDGIKLPQVAFWHDDPSVTHCHDCLTPKGGFHHPGCDMERCPKCGGQLIGCGCLEPEDEDVS